jgi:hypothetical protein
MLMKANPVETELTVDFLIEAIKTTGHPRRKAYCLKELSTAIASENGKKFVTDALARNVAEVMIYDASRSARVSARQALGALLGTAPCPTELARTVLAVGKTAAKSLSADYRRRAQRDLCSLLLDHGAEPGLAEIATLALTACNDFLSQDVRTEGVKILKKLTELGMADAAIVRALERARNSRNHVAAGTALRALDALYEHHPDIGALSSNGRIEIATRGLQRLTR